MIEMNLEARKPGRALGLTSLTDRVIGAAISVHKELGPGFIESIYEQALAIELASQNVQFERQYTLPIKYRGQQVGEHRLDFLIEKCLIVEVKAIADLVPVHFAVVRSYLKAADLEDALLLNFAATTLTVKRV